MSAPIGLLSLHAGNLGTFPKTGPWLLPPRFLIYFIKYIKSSTKLPLRKTTETLALKYRESNTRRAQHYYGIEAILHKKSTP
jgi:hypothetical protein